MRYTASWPGSSDGSNNIVTISGPGVDSLYLIDGGNVDVDRITEALDAAFEAGRASVDEAQRFRAQTIRQLQSDLKRAGDKNAKLEAENTRLNSQLNQQIFG